MKKKKTKIELYIEIEYSIRFTQDDVVLKCFTVAQRTSGDNFTYMHTPVFALLAVQH